MTNCYFVLHPVHIQPEYVGTSRLYLYKAFSSILSSTPSSSTGHSS